MKRILLAGGITYLADEYSSVPEYRGWIGFGLSSAATDIGRPEHPNSQITPGIFCSVFGWTSHCYVRP